MIQFLDDCHDGSSGLSASLEGTIRIDEVTRVDTLHFSSAPQSPPGRTGPFPTDR